MPLDGDPDAAALSDLFDVFAEAGVARAVTDVDDLEIARVHPAAKEEIGGRGVTLV